MVVNSRIKVFFIAISAEPPIFCRSAGESVVGAVRIGGSNLVVIRKRCDEVADDLVNLYGQTFGGRGAGKFRISRKFLRQLAGRRHLSPAFIEEVVEEMYERGFALIDLETYFAVIDQRHFNSYRRVTAAATEQILAGADGR